MGEHAPVSDWGTDFDHRDPRWIENPFPIWDELRVRCPVARSARFEDGAYFPSRYEDVREIAYDSEHFSSRRVIVREKKVPLQLAPPITSDPPEHTGARKLLLPAFAPQAIAKLEPRTRAICRELLDRIGDRKEADAAVDYAQHIPVRLIAHMLGVPEDEGELFRKWIHLVLEVGISDESVILPALQEMSAYFFAEIEKRGDHRGDDLISFLLDARMNGQPLPDPHLIGTLRLLLIAGIDTTWSGIGASLWHLAAHAEDRRRLVAEPALLPTAIEEFLRAYAPVTMAREVVEGDHARRLPVQGEGPGAAVVSGGQPRPHQVRAGRPGAHRPRREPPRGFRPRPAPLSGSNLARLEMTVAVEEWLRRFPNFALVPGTKVTWSEGTVRGPRRLPVALS